MLNPSLAQSLCFGCWLLPASAQSPITASSQGLRLSNSGLLLPLLFPLLRRLSFYALGPAPVLWDLDLISQYPQLWVRRRDVCSPGECMGEGSFPCLALAHTCPFLFVYC